MDFVLFPQQLICCNIGVHYPCQFSTVQVPVFLILPTALPRSDFRFLKMGYSMQAENSVTITYKGFHLKVPFQHKTRVVKGFVSPSTVHYAVRQHIFFIATFRATRTCSLSQCFRRYVSLYHDMLLIANVAILYVGKVILPSSMKPQRSPTSLIISSFILHYTYHLASHSAHRIDC